MEKRNGNWQATYSGGIYPADPKVEEINLEDISHGLALICRFSGQCQQFYSVGQHSLNVFEDLRKLGYDRETQLVGLLHDASEAYICDIPKPFKGEMSKYVFYEEQLQKKIFEAFGIPFPTDEIHKIIKISDNDVFYNESKLLMKNSDIWVDKNYRKIDIDVRERDWREVKQEFDNKVKKLLKKNV